MDNSPLIKAINKNLDKIPSQFRYIVDIIGIEPLLVLCEKFGGSALYIPTLKRLFAECIAEQIKYEFNGCNYRELAVKYGFCERTIRNITSNNKKYHW